MFVYEALDHVQNPSTDNTTVKTITLTVGTKAVAISVKAASGGAYVTFDGTTPSASEGLYFPASAMPCFLPCGPVTDSIKFLATDAGGADVDVLCLG